MARRRKPPRAGALSELQPGKIAAQIAILQALYYLTACVLMLFTALVAGMGFSLDMVLGWESVRGDTTNGWLLSFIWLIDGGLFMAVALVILIARSKLVPDFALTIHVLHLVFTSLYTRSLPRHSMWWMTMAGSSAVSVALGMWGCRYRELQPVFFGGGRILGAASGSRTNNTQVPSAAAVENGEAGYDTRELEAEELGLSRGRGRGRDKDGGGAYEMMQMK
ncbi:Integral membrane protein SYS1-related protein [Moelleriella libera RCEF 2490]|uniref:Integral membrane protein SYS1-related protein n=1 Tax=Moelleriella libera RCEF 2490 TaxID=1081109 RepID=A0A167ZBG6_9HYPO|nr:Integral membrane protein SYS1-related protein [Moelleriella libera RCEF 2490]